MEKLPIVCDGERVGEAETARERLYVRVSVRTGPRRGIWRAWAVGDAGEILVGTLEPVNGEQAVSRRFSGRELSKAGELSRVELRPAEVPQEARRDTEARQERGPTETAARPGQAPTDTEAWRRSAQGQRLFRNARFQRQLRNVRDALTRSDGERRRVALVREDNAPFPLPELFCLASAVRIGARDYWVFSFDRQGWPVL